MWGSKASRGLSTVAAAALGAIVLSACGSEEPDLVAGKQQFVAKCGSCHVLGRAGTKGIVGPNLDEAFQQGLKDGLGRSGVEGLTHEWIQRPNPASAMPAKLVTGDTIGDVAAYVAASVSAGGKDTGLLATAVKAAGDGKPAVAKAGVIDIEADPTGQLAYVTKAGEAPAGPLKVQSSNKSSTPHNIVIDGKGEGEVVQGGGVSEFDADFAAGEYTFYCSVTGHRAAGMEGKITVK